MRRSLPSWPLLLLLPSIAACGGTPTPPDDAGTDAPHDAAPDCRADAECDDGLICNGVEHCTSGRCVAGTPMRCDDAIACTIDSCSEALARCVYRVPDEDGDGSGAATCVDGTGTPLGTDCDDHAANRFPGNTELCDAAHVDEDCDPTTLGGRDDDHDGYVSALCCDGTTCGNDCDDTRDSVHPGATESCNHLDDNCNGMVDEGVSVSGFVDADRDGYGDATMPITACGTAVGFSADGTDCDDTNPAVHPGQPELCDGIDNDCNPATPIDASAMSVLWYRDADGDGFGTPSTSMLSCAPPAGYVILGTDCDDMNAGRSPATAELCNGIDDDCNGVADFVIAPGDLEDDDRDGIPDANCHDPRASDCDDRDPTSGPGEPEACDGRDNDCDGTVDEDATSVAFYRDADGDGFGSSSSVTVACTAPPGFARRGGDCDDTSSARFPGALEACNDIDDDCDTAIDEGTYASSTCASLHAAGQCVLGTCRTGACDPGYADCSTTEAGCESDILTSALHCGSCSPCPPGGECMSGTCVITCPPYASCNAHNPCSWSDNCGATGVCSGTITDCAATRIDAYPQIATALGGPGTGTSFTDTCPQGLLPIGLEASIATAGSGLTQVAIDCASPTIASDGSITLTPSVRLPSSGGEACCTAASASTGIACPPGSVIVGYGGSFAGGVITELALRCAQVGVTGTAATAFTLVLGTVTTTASLGAPMGTPIPATDCPMGDVAQGMHGTGTTTLDGFGLDCGAPQLALAATTPDSTGGGGGVSYQDCPPGQVPISITGATSNGFYAGVLSNVSFACGTLTVQPNGANWDVFVSPGGATLPTSGVLGPWCCYDAPMTATCPANQAMVGLAGAGNGQLTPMCAPVIVTGDPTNGFVVSYGTAAAAGTVGTGGGGAFGPYMCPPGMLGIGFRPHSGDILDGIAFRCGPPIITIAPPA